MNEQFSARITGGFWKKRQDNIADNVLWRQLDILEGQREGLDVKEVSPVIDSFRYVAGLIDTPYKGKVFSDSEWAKWLEAVAYSLQNKPDAALEAKADLTIDLICSCQMEDGYLNTYFQALHPNERLHFPAFSCELYNIGHLMEAAVAYYRCTGKRKLLDAICRAGDLLCRMIGPGDGQTKIYDGHAELELGLLRLFDATGTKRYLDLCEFLVNERGKQPSPLADQDAPSDFETGSGSRWFGLDHHQAHKPVREQREADGHAVKVTYLYSAVTELATRGKDPDGSLLAATKAVWNNMVRHRMYITGGIGSQGFAERFTVDDDLPPDRGYAETCASIGVCFWAKRLLDLHPDVQYADVMEQALYNGVLAGWSLEGNDYFYVNVLHSKPAISEYREDHRHVTTSRRPWYECACCPSNIMRLVARIQDYCYSLRDESLYVHLFAESSVEWMAGNQRYAVAVHTAYPYDGNVWLEFQQAPNQSYTIALRVPSWCSSAILIVNGNDVHYRVQDGYALICREWKIGDVVEWRMAFTPTLMQGNPAFWECSGKAALVNGPLVYCLEGVDHEKGLNGISFAMDSTYQQQNGSGVLSDEKILVGSGLRRPSTDQPYRPFVPDDKVITITAIPYFAWNNRGENDMDVWLPITQQPKEKNRHE